MLWGLTVKAFGWEAQEKRQAGRQVHKAVDHNINWHSLQVLPQGHSAEAAGMAHHTSRGV
jgi:hypothetical protein